ncbi:MAG: GGDEF domain-containing protein [Opitutaceae bacterium]
MLLIEDEPVAAKITERMLHRKGGGRYSVTHASTLAAARAELGEGNFDIVLSDLNLPDSEGLETLSCITEIAPELAVVVLTASSDDEIGIRAMQLGAQDFLVKGDFNESALQRSILQSVERHRLQRVVRQLAIIDELTGLYNRRGFNSLQASIVQRAMETSCRGFVCYFDLDRFKQINDELGHQRGDEALAEFAMALKNVFRKDTLLARFGGDEFVALGVEPRECFAAETLQTLESVLIARNSCAGVAFRIETSAGLAQFGRDKPAEMEALLAEADNQLYSNKQRRKRLRAVDAEADMEEIA